jgi:hypothetical protein
MSEEAIVKDMALKHDDTALVFLKTKNEFIGGTMVAELSLKAVKRSALGAGAMTRFRHTTTLC